MRLTTTVSRNLHAARVRRHLTQQDIAAKAGVSVSYVSMLEREQRAPPLATLEALAKALAVSPLELLKK